MDASTDSFESPYSDALSSLDQAILATVTYRDLFDYPVDAEEIHRYLHRTSCTSEDVVQRLGADQPLAEFLVTDGQRYALSHRNDLLALRDERESHAAVLWPRASRHARILASLPFVKMIAVTGSLAVNNPGHDADTDFMLITEPGRVWTARLFARFLQAINERFGGGEMCVNHVVSEAALNHPQQNLYVAQEITQMVPVFGRATYQQFREANDWTSQFLPNAGGAPPIHAACEPRFPRLRALATRLLNSPPGRWLERWERERKLHRYNETEFLMGRSTPFTAEATGHRRNVREAIETAFADRLKGPRAVRNNLRILVSQAYHLNRDPKLWRAMQPFPPLGSLYAAAVARSRGHDVRVHDAMLSVSLGEWRAALQINNPDVVVLFEDNFNYLSKMCLLSMRDAAFEMIAAARQRGATVLVCSSDSADEPKAYLEAGADYILIGEGEATLGELLDVIDAGDDPTQADIAGLAYRGDNGDVVRTARRLVMRHIDELPLPAWDLIDLRRYQEIWQRRHGRSPINVVTTRGCPYHCNWCAKPIWGQRYNARSPENVVKELAWLKTQTDYDHVWFMDDIFGLKPRWIQRFADELRRQQLRIRFKCLSRPDLLLRKDEVTALAAAGCDIVWMGAESGSQKILDAMEKGTTVGNIFDSVNALRDAGIRVGLFIQFGYPGETRADIRKTIAMLRQLMPDEVGVSVSYPLPGTRFFERVQESLGDTRHWQDSDDLAMLYRGPFNTGFYRALHRYVHADLAIRRHWRTGRLLHWGYSVASAMVFRTAMVVNSWLPHRSTAPLRAEMAPDQAAVPTDQSDS